MTVTINSDPQNPNTPAEKAPSPSSSKAALTATLNSRRDYALTRQNQQHAKQLGLVDADWYRSPIAPEEMAKLLQRRNWPAIRDTLLWFAILISSGALGAYLWPSPWAIVPFLVYGVIYATTSDSRWHESSHGTPFKTDWLNVALYEISSFMVFRESTVWRWSHFRHHSDTLVVGQDPEIAAQRPTSFFRLASFFTGIPGFIATSKSIALHATGRLTEAESLFIPEQEKTKVFVKARIYLAIYAATILFALYLQSWLPLMFIGLPTLYGSWLMPIYGLTQHTGLAEDQTDHRFNCRTVHMNLLNRFLYWNMGYHIEHHMFPMVPYYNLPKLHALMKDDCPPAYPSLWAAWREIIPALKKQQKDVNYYVKRPLPETAQPTEYRAKTIAYFAHPSESDDGWLRVDGRAPKDGQAIRVDYQDQTFAVYRTADQKLFATDGYCTHGAAHLADGLICGDQIECPKHNGRFGLTDGSCQRAPVTTPVNTYPVEVRNNNELWLNCQPYHHQTNTKKTVPLKTVSYTVVSNKLLTPFITELVLMPTQTVTFRAGDYIQLVIPKFEKITPADFDIPETFLPFWQGLEPLSASNQFDLHPVLRNYSIANAVNDDNTLRFTIRIALPLGDHAKNRKDKIMPNQALASMGLGSSFVFSLKPGDTVESLMPAGDFHIKPTDKEMVYVGGGAGMAPIRAHIDALFKQGTTRKVSYWYGARTQHDLLYFDHFQTLAAEHGNFTYVAALSEQVDKSNWQGETGFIHEVLNRRYLQTHPNLAQIEFYLCGPPPMIDAMESLLKQYGVSPDAIAYDIF